MQRAILPLLVAALTLGKAQAQTELDLQARATTASGDFAPLWLNANKYGLSSLDKTSGYARATLIRHMDTDSSQRWAWGAGADVALATGFTSTLVVHQAYGEVRYLKGRLTVGSKEQPMQLKNQQLSSGSQTLGINARPVPSVRLEMPDYWDVPGTRHWLAFKGHIAYGLQTDDRWQKDFTDRQDKYTEHTRIHTKAGYLRLGRPDKPLTVEMGLEMGCQYGGTSYAWIEDTQEFGLVKNSGGLQGMWRALIPGGSETVEKDTDYKNAEGNHLGSWVLRVNYDTPDWGLSVYADHFFEDHSAMFFLDYDGYGTGDDWDKKKHFRWFVYDLRDMMLGAELRLKHTRWVDACLLEYIYSKYQSGPIYHDHTMQMSDHVSGNDNYYNHYIFTGWQHWGQVMGNPLYRSPLYNSDGHIMVKDNRFWAWHAALSGHPTSQLSYRLMATWQRGFGTYNVPFVSPRRNTSLLAEAHYDFSDGSCLEGWSLTAAFAMDRGSLLGDNTGAQFTITKRLNLD